MSIVLNKTCSNESMIQSQKPLWGLQSLPGLKLVDTRLAELCHGTDAWTPIFAKAVIEGGKRLRPALVLLCASFGSSSPEKLIDVATAAELIHAASLVHDDIIDKAESRRGNPTISNRFGTQQAVLYGDFLFARSFSVLTKHGYSGILEKMTRAISLMCEGEIEQSARLYDCSVTEADYMSYIQKKTAYFLSVCCMAGGEAGGLNQSQQQYLASFGLHLGNAFQITDDLLDYTGKKAVTGKPTLKDLSEGYLTLPVIQLLRHPQYSAKTREIIEQRQFSEENLIYIQNALQLSGITTKISKNARNQVTKAKYFLNKLSSKPARASLVRLADSIVLRNS